MRLSRRSLLRYLILSAASLGVSQLQIDKLGSVLASSTAPPVLWLNGSSCSGCSVSLLNAVNPSIDSVLTQTINLQFHPTIMSAAGDLAVNALSAARNTGGYVLVVEGAVPTAQAGRYCIVYEQDGTPVTMLDAALALAENASHIVAVGSCASFGGVSGACPDTHAQGLGSALGRAVINLPGCPAHPDWIIGSLVALLTGTPVQLDEFGRPTVFYTSTVIHERCPRREREDASSFAQHELCLEELGCKGPRTHADCDTRKWNNGLSWCIGANALCIGCTEPDFPAFPFHGGGGD
ncbi:MAG: hydrogenase small subunit [Anaerolineae bacterium]